MARHQNSIRNQLLVLGVLATGSIWTGALLQYRQLRQQHNHLQEVRANLTESSLYSTVVKHTARERGLSNGWLLKTIPATPAAAGPTSQTASGDPKAPLVHERAALDTAMEKLALATNGTLRDDVRAYQADLSHYRTQVDHREIAPAAAFAGYTKLVAAVQSTSARELAEGMREVSLPYEHVNHINQSVEELAQLRGLIFGVFSNGRMDDSQRLEISRQLTLYQEYMRLYQETKPPEVYPLEAHGFDPAKMERMLAIVQQVLSSPALPSVDWWPLATAAVDELQNLADRESAQLTTLADERINSLEHKLFMIVATLILLGIVTLGLALVTVSRIVLGLGKLLGGLESVAVRGNFKTRIEVDRKDEFGTIGASVNKLIALAASAVDRHERNSQHDGLTRVLNRRGLDEEMSARFTLRHDDRSTLSALMLDVDHFKGVNDEFGHQTGDAILIAVADLIAQQVRPGDAVGRYGGEEFLALLDDCHLADAARVAENIRQVVAKQDFGLGRPVTISIGVAECADGETAASLISRADRALYSAKNKGRNQIVTDRQPPLLAGPLAV